MLKKSAVLAVTLGVLAAWATAGQSSWWSPAGLFGCWTPADELVGFRSEGSKTFDNHDGTWSTVFGTTFHERGPDGSWVELAPGEFSAGQETGETDAEVILTTGVSPSYGYNMWYVGSSASYFRCQCLYLNSEMGALALGGTITDIAFNADTPEPNADTLNNSEQWLKDTTMTGFDTTQWHVPGTLVYSGNLITTGTGYITMHLATPFTHTAGSNLLLSYRHQDGSNEATYKQYQASYVNGGGAPYLARRGRSLTVNPPTTATATSRAICKVTYTPPPGSHFDNLALSPSYPWGGEAIGATAKVYDDLAPVDSARLFYSRDRSTWTRVTPDSTRASDSSCFFTIPGRPEGESLHCYGRTWSQSRSFTSLTVSRKIPRNATIYQIQYCDTLVSQNSAWRDSFVRTTGVVTGTVTSLKFYLGMPAGGPWSGLFAHNGLGTVIGVGDSLDIVGRINEANEVTIDTCYRIVKNAAGRRFDSTRVIVPQSRTELYEGALLRMDSVCLRDTVGNFAGGASYYLFNAAKTESVVLYTYPNSGFAQTPKPKGIFTLICNGHHYTPNHEVVPRYYTDIIPIVDVQAVEILGLPSTMNAGEMAVPRLVVKNISATDTARNVLATVSIGSSYVVSQLVSSLAPSHTDTLQFSEWMALGGVHPVLGAVAFANDPNRANDSVRATVTVSGSTTGAWTAKSQMPLPPSGKQLKDGGWLAYDGSRQYVYAAKSNKTSDFYFYDPKADSWHQAAPWPRGTEDKPPSKGAVGCATGSGVIYATKGNNTQGFWKYDAARDSWYQKASVPLGLWNKKVKGGTDIVYARKGTTYSFYVLKGYKNEFWRYDAARDSWYSLPAAPVGVNLKWDKGSWLAYDGASTIYAHKAKYHEFYSYNTETDSWGTSPLKAMPIASYTGKTRKTSDGGCAAYLNGHVYAFKGANTQELWRYYTDGDSWRELDTIPALGPSGSKKRVKGGADIVAVGNVLYATKGNKCNEIWKYTPFAPLGPGMGERFGVTADNASVPAGVSFSLAPNPLARGFTTLRAGRALASSTPGLVSIFDASGRLVRRTAVCDTRSATTLDLRSLRQGVYMVRLEVGGFAATQKLVVQK